MKREYVDTYKCDNHLHRDEEVAVVVKSFSHCSMNGRSNNYSTGAVFKVRLNDQTRNNYNGMVSGTISRMLAFPAHLNDLCFLPQPTSVDFYKTKMVIASGYEVIVVDRGRWSHVRRFKNEWFGCLSSACFSLDGTKILVASSGFDSIFEIDSETGEVLWKWHAYDNEYHQAPAGYWVTFDEPTAREFREQNGRVLLIKNYVKWRGFGLPARSRTCNITSVSYDGDGGILAALGHANHCIKINQKAAWNRNMKVVDVSSPISFRRAENEYYVAALDEGSVIMLDDDCNVRRVLDFSKLGNVDKRRKGKDECITSIRFLAHDTYIVTDLHRSSIHLVNVRLKTRRSIAFPTNWSVADVKKVPSTHLNTALFSII